MPSDSFFKLKLEIDKLNAVLKHKGFQNIGDFEGIVLDGFAISASVARPRTSA